MEEKDNIRGITYKINENSSYKVKTRTWNGKTFYNVRLRQKMFDGTFEDFDRQLLFVGCTPPQDGEYIKINRGFESNYRNPRDKYNWITTVIVQDFEVVDPPEEVRQAAFEEYNQKTQENSEEITITSEDLPF